MNDTLKKKKLQNLFEHVHEQVREHLSKEFVQIVHEQEFDLKTLDISFNLRCLVF